MQQQQLQMPQASHVFRTGSTTPRLHQTASPSSYPVPLPCCCCTHIRTYLSSAATGHMTMLLGAAKLLKEREDQLGGTVLLVFQPAEEGGAGADVMIQAGAIDGASAAYALHVWPTLPTGQLATRSGTIMAGVSLICFSSSQSRPPAGACL